MGTSHTCERFTARQAHDYGLVIHLVPDGEELKTVREIPARIAEKPPLPVVLTKSTMKTDDGHARRGCRAAFCWPISGAPARS